MTEVIEGSLEAKLKVLYFNQLVMFTEDLAEEIRDNANQGASDKEWQTAQAMKVAEEAGEFIGAYNRWTGFCRRDADLDEVTSELADVIIASFVMFANLGVDAQWEIRAKLHKVVTRGYVNKEG